MKRPTQAQKRGALLKAGWVHRKRSGGGFAWWHYGDSIWATTELKVAYSIELSAARARARRRKK